MLSQLTVDRAVLFDGGSGGVVATRANAIRFLAEYIQHHRSGLHTVRSTFEAGAKAAETRCELRYTPSRHFRF